MKKVEKASGVTEEEITALNKLLAKKGELAACSNCGSLNIGFGSVSNTVKPAALPGDSLSGYYKCKVCSHEGPAAIFKNVNGYVNFFNSKKH